MNLYVVRNKEGKFFKNKGYGGYGSNWKDNLDQAKFYPKVGQAKSRVTYFAKHFPEYGVCDILEFSLDVAQAKVLDMGKVTRDSLEKSRRAAEEAEQRRRQDEIDRLEEQRARIDEDIARRRQAYENDKANKRY